MDDLVDRVVGPSVITLVPTQDRRRMIRESKHFIGTLLREGKEEKERQLFTREKLGMFK